MLIFTDPAPERGLYTRENVDIYGWSLRTSIYLNKGASPSASHVEHP